MEFHGEHLFWGLLGRASIWIAFFMAIGSVLAYSLYTAKSSANYHLKRFARILFTGHAFFLLLASAALYIIIYNHYFEYNYVWKHSSRDTPIAYIISCFWAGQEGSFLIWLVMQAVLGVALIKKAGKFEPTVLAVVAGVQLLLLLNLLGFQLGSFQLGSSPFFLLREVADDPMFLMPDYLSFITDGNGLNPLLQNPWMVSHPPLIFMGYALTLVPFALTIAALVHKNTDELIKPLIFSTLIALFFLGIGLIVGGAWAYEALTFGGFWAWDPVENASLVPWIILLAALHLQLIVRRKNALVLPALLFSSLAYVLVVYASFLTRSGILAESSAHSFGSGGFQYQLVVLLAFVALLPALLLIWRKRELKRADNSSILSTEFVMYIGSIVLILSAFQIIFTTSLPVFNALFGLHLAPPAQPEVFYNNWQLPFAVAICLLVTIASFLILKRRLIGLLIPSLLALVFTFIAVWLLKTYEIKYILLYLTSFLCIFFTFDMLLCYFRKAPNRPAVLTHLGFGVFILGILMTFSNQSYLSISRPTMFQSEMPQGEPQLVLTKDRVVQAGDYYVVYRKRETIKNNITFDIQFYTKHNEDSLKYAFSLNPYIVLNSNMGNVYEPDIRKFFLKDVFTYIAHAPLDEPGTFSLMEKVDVKLNDTLVIAGLLWHMDSLWVSGNADSLLIENLSVYARFVSNAGDTLIPAYEVRQNQVHHSDATADNGSLMLRFEEVSGIENTINAGFYQKNDDIIALKVIVFPYINLMWLGAALLFAGFIAAIIKRSRKSVK